MNNKQLKSSVRTLIFDLLREQNEEEKDEKSPEEKPKSSSKASKGDIRIATGAVGRGRFKKFVGEAGSRAKKDPKGLMKDLGISGGSSGDDIAQILKILNSAIHKNATMSQAYSGAKSVSEKIKDGDPVKGVGVSLSKLDQRNGVKFISHTLTAAKNAGYLKLKGGVEIGKGASAAIVIYSV